MMMVGVDGSSLQVDSQPKSSDLVWDSVVTQHSSELPPVTFGHSSGNYCANLMILSTLWTEKICIQAQSKICHHWRHLANMTELSVCGGNVALCQTSSELWWLSGG